MSNERKYKSAYGMKHKRNALQPGMKGFLCSCNFREKDCVRESYNILNFYADQMLENPIETVADATAEAEGNEIEEDLKKEIANLKEDRKGTSSKRFQVVESGAKNFLFIKSTVDDPCKLGETIVKAIYERREKQVRFLLRLVPIEVVCKANLTDIKQGLMPLVDKYFKDSPRTFSIAFNHRNNDSVPRDEVIKQLADVITESRSDHTVNLKNPEVTVIVEIIRNMALLSVLPDYFKYKKYNLHALAENETAETNEDNAV